LLSSDKSIFPKRHHWCGKVCTLYLFDTAIIREMRLSILGCGIFAASFVQAQGINSDETHYKGIVDGLYESTEIAGKIVEVKGYITRLEIGAGSKPFVKFRLNGSEASIGCYMLGKLDKDLKLNNGDDVYVRGVLRAKNNLETELFIDASASVETGFGVKVDSMRAWRYELKATQAMTSMVDGVNQKLSGKNLELGGSLTARLYDSTFPESGGAPHILFDYTFGSDYRGLNDKNRNSFTLDLRAPENDGLLPFVPAQLIYRIKYEADEGSKPTKEFSVGLRGTYDPKIKSHNSIFKAEISGGFDIGERFGSGTTEASIFRMVMESKLEYSPTDRIKVSYSPSLYLNFTRVGDRSDFYHFLGVNYVLIRSRDMVGEGKPKPKIEMSISAKTGNGRRPSGFNSDSKTQFGLNLAYRF
jgi:hypothetical protein